MRHNPTSPSPNSSRSARISEYRRYMLFVLPLIAQMSSSVAAFSAGRLYSGRSRLSSFVSGGKTREGYSPVQKYSLRSLSSFTHFGYHRVVPSISNNNCFLAPNTTPLRHFSITATNGDHEYFEITTTSSTSTSNSFSIEDYRLPKLNAFQPELRKNQRIVTFGDVHGDIEALKDFLVTAKVMDPTSTPENPIWIGGDTLCVQCGDVLDRGDEELACLRLLTSLARQAQNDGGALYLLFGNHESLNAVGLFQYADPGGNDEFEYCVGKNMDVNLNTEKWRLRYAGNEPARWIACEPGGLLAEPLFGNMNVAVVLGKTVFVHAGLTANHVREHGSIEKMNRVAREWMMKSHDDQNNIDYEKLQTVNEVIAAAQNRAVAASESMPSCLGGGIGSHSPVWMRDYSSPHDKPPSNPRAQAMIDETLREIGYDTQRIVMGHTPQMHINGALRGKAWRVDVGASKGVMDGTPEVLEIIHSGDGDDDILNILTMDGDKVNASERLVQNTPFLRFF